MPASCACARIQKASLQSNAFASVPLRIGSDRIGSGGDYLPSTMWHTPCMHASRRGDA
jgi:hypothetical protein